MQKKLAASTILALSLAFSLGACSRGEKKLKSDCEKVNGGDACNKLGLKLKGQEALQFFRAGCQKQNSESCVNLASRTPDPQEAARVMKQACGLQNAGACAKIGEPLTNASPGKNTPAPADNTPAPVTPVNNAAPPPVVDRSGPGKMTEPPPPKPGPDEYYSESAGRVLKKKTGRFNKQKN